MDMFAHNLQIHAHYTKLNTAKLNTTGGYRPALFNNNTIKDRHVRTYQPRPQSPAKPHNSVIKRSTFRLNCFQRLKPYKEENKRIKFMLLNQTDFILNQLPF